MSIILQEGFDHYNTSTTATDGSGIQTNWVCGFWSDRSIIAGRYGGQALRNARAGGREDIYRDLISSISSGTLGWDWRPVSALSGQAVQLYSTAGSTPQITLMIKSDGAIEVRRGDLTGTVIGTSTTGIMVADAWRYCECVFTISDAAGVITLYVEDNAGVMQSVLSLTSVDTKNHASDATVGRLVFPESGGQNDLDNVYISTTQQTWGPLQVYRLTVNADISNTGFSASSGSDLYAMVDEAVSDGDTTYIEASVTNDQVLLDLPNLPTTGTVRGVQVTHFSKNTDAGVRNLTCLLNDGTNTSESAGDAITTTYDAYQKIFDTAPDGGAWDASKVNALRVGVKLA